MSANLKIAQGLSLPLDLVTQTVAILAKRRAGKSYTMRRLVEQLARAGQQVVLVDPKGDQWGIRSAADGKSPGLPIVILGGERGDVPLEASSGELVAKLVVEERVSALLDLSLFRKYEVATFMTAFLENLYRLKAREIYRTPMMLVIDEADAVAPQKPQKGEERMLGAAEDIVRRGGQRGIGCVLVTQRSAVLNKNVLTQAQMLVVLRTIAPQDLSAMDAWIDVHGEEAQRKTLMESLPSLPVGDAWFWSPGWPTTEGIFKRVHVLPIDTFDSGASPKPGAKPVEPKQLADVDLDALKGHMAATIEKAKAADPKLLRKRIAELEKERAQERKHPLHVVDTNALDQAEKRGYVRGEAAAHAENADALKTTLQYLKGAVQVITHSLEHSAKRLKAPPPAVPQVYANRHTPAPRQTQRPPLPRGSGPGEDLPKGERVVLTATAQHPEGVTREQLTVLTGYKRSSRDTYLQRLRERGYVEPAGEQLVATAAGVQALGADFEPLPTGAALREHWLAELPEGERRVLAVAIDAYPAFVERDVISEKTDYKRSSRDTYLQRLSARQLVTSERGAVRASDQLFD